MSKKSFNKTSRKKESERRLSSRWGYTYGSSPDDRVFETQLLEKGLVVKRMESDGNCLFRAIADQLGRDAEDHLTLRQAVVEYMEVIV